MSSSNKDKQQMLSKHIREYENVAGGKILELRRFHNFLIKGGNYPDDNVSSSDSDFSSDSSIYDEDDERRLDEEYALMSDGEKMLYELEMKEKRKARKKRPKMPQRPLHENNINKISPKKNFNRVKVYQTLGLLGGVNQLKKK